jgi:prolipoprotein diacylglyceryltransferase
MHPILFESGGLPIYSYGVLLFIVDFRQFAETPRDHPTQLYDAAAELLILVFLLVTERKGRPDAGRTFRSYLLLYGISRFVDEAVKSLYAA